MNKAKQFKKMKGKLTKVEVLSRIYGAMKVVANKQQTLRLNVDGMNVKTRTAVTAELRNEGFAVKVTKDKDVKNRLWYELDWSI